MYAPWATNRKTNAIRIKRHLDSCGIPTQLTSAREDEPVWESRKRALRTYNEDATHLVSLQDDLALTSEFVALVHDAVVAKPNTIISLFCAWTDPVETAHERGLNWTRTPGFWGQAIVLPVGFINPLIDWCDKYVVGTEQLGADDYRMSIWANYVMDGMVWTTVPSLVEHVGHDQSELGNNPPIDRTATWYDDSITTDVVDFSNQSDVPKGDGPFGDGSGMRDSLSGDPETVSQPQPDPR